MPPAASGAGSDVRTAWEAVRAEAMRCTRCPLHKLGTRTVFGEGPLDAAIMLVGEQPGDQENLAGRPLVTVALGATAVRAMFGKAVTIARMRGAPHEVPDGGEGWVTVHPSFLLRVRDDREEVYARFVEDLRLIGERAKALAA